MAIFGILGYIDGWSEIYSDFIINLGDKTQKESLAKIQSIF